MEELEAVYYAASSFVGNEEEVASHYIIEQTIESNANANIEGQEVYLETLDHKQPSISEESESKGSGIDSTMTTEGEHEQVIVMKEDGRVVIVQKEGNEGDMILGTYVEEDIVDGAEKDQVHSVQSDYNMGDVAVTEIDSQRNIDGNCKLYDLSSCDPKEQPSSSESVTTIYHLDKREKKRITAKVVKGIEPRVRPPKEVEDGPVVDKLTCKYCFKKFTKTSNKQRHYRVVHKMKKNTGNDIKCIECDINFKHINKLREHLQGQHGLEMSDQTLTFPNMSAFRKWKCEIERKTLCSYTLRHGSRKTVKGPKLFYMCHRSGKYLPKVGGEKRQRMLRVGGTCKLGIACTAAIYCQECTNEVQVRYVPHHYGHGKETSFVQLSPAEQAAIQESVTSGVPFEKLLDDIRDSEYKDTFQLHLLKRRDIRWINCAFNAEEYNPGISDAESVENWVKRCCQMEDSPVLFYQQQNIGSDQEEFMLVIMTEFQKHILLSSQRNVVCVDSLYRRKGGRFYLTVLLVMDEFDNAFPGAFCISNKVEKCVIEQFLMSIKESTGKLSFKHFMSDNEPFFYEAWVSVMEDEPRWLWSIFYIDSKIRTQLKVFRGNVAGRAEVYKTMRTLLECQNESVFTCMFKNFVESLNKDPTSKKLADFILSKYGSNTEMWASCYRKEVNLSTNIHLEVMHRTFRYCCREGRKKRLDKFLFVVMKLIKCKMLDRIADMLDSDKLKLAIDAINMCHASGLEIPAEHMSTLSEKIWLINTDNDEEPMYVTKELDKCPEHCSLRCDECDICVHQYSCTCVHSMIDANLCRHIHAVVWKFLTPHFSPAPSPSHSIGPMMDDDMEVSINASADAYYGSTLKKTHEVYRKLKANKCNLNKESLDSIMKLLNKCVDICVGKKIDEPPKEPPAPAVPPSTVYVINPYSKNPSQPYILPNILPAPQPANNTAPVSQYVMLLPNNGRILPKL